MYGNTSINFHLLTFIILFFFVNNSYSIPKFNLNTILKSKTKTNMFISKSDNYKNAIFFPNSDIIRELMNLEIFLIIHQDIAFIYM